MTQRSTIQIPKANKKVKDDSTLALDLWYLRVPHRGGNYKKPDSAAQQVSALSVSLRFQRRLKAFSQAEQLLAQDSILPSNSFKPFLN